MKFLKDKSFYKILSLLSKKRKKQLYFLIFFLTLNGALEFFSVASIIPLLSIISSENISNSIPIIGKYITLLNINDPSLRLLFFTLSFCIFVFSSTLLRIFNIAYIFRLSAKVNIDISNLIFRNNMYQSYAKYTNKNSSEIITLALEKVDIATACIDSLLTVIASTMLGISIIISLLILKWQVVMIGIIFIYFYYSLVYTNIKKMLYKDGKITSRIIPLRLKVLQEGLEGYKDIIINSLEKVYTSLFYEYQSVIKLKQANLNFFLTIPRILIEGIILTIIAILAYFLFKSQQNIASSIPLIGSFIYAFQRLLPLTQQIYAASANYKYKSTVINDLVNDLEEGKNNQALYLSKKRIYFKKKLLFKGIKFGFKNKNNVLNNINIRIDKGDIIGIYGETGSGKSTLLNIIMGLVSPSSGNIKIDNIDISNENSLVNWTINFAHVPQNIFLKEATIEENIAFGEEKENIDFELLVKAAKVAHIYSFIKNTDKGFKTLVGERGILLSGGQRQRIAIARAIYKSRNILVLDEATSALDDSTEEKILRSILDMYRNLTIIMVTHRTSTLKNCNRIFKVQNGKIIEEKKVT
ncbi:hypothetical protein CL656_06435 [bacterium]|nr:hypothetical protein [bacterium]